MARLGSPRRFLLLLRHRRSSRPAPGPRQVRGGRGRAERGRPRRGRPRAEPPGGPSPLPEGSLRAPGAALDAAGGCWGGGASPGARRLGDGEVLSGAPHRNAGRQPAPWRGCGAGGARLRGTGLRGQQERLQEVRALQHGCGRVPCDIPAPPKTCKSPGGSDLWGGVQLIRKISTPGETLKQVYTQISGEVVIFQISYLTWIGRDILGNSKPLLGLSTT